MKGSVGLKSKPGEGSTFWFEVPLKQEQTEQRNREKPENNFGNNGESPISGMKILVAEDDKMNQLVVQKFLDREGLTVDVVETGVEAIKAVENTNYDAILMDVQMPEMDGYEATKLIREKESETGLRIPIFMLTASAMAEDRENSLDAGADEFITKPLDKDRLINTIYKYLDLTNRRSDKKLVEKYEK